MPDVKDSLASLGLSVDEIAIYYHLLEQGGATILQIARQTGIPRTSVYVAIESLCTKQLLILDAKDEKKMYHAAEPASILEYGKRRQQHLAGAVRSLEEEIELMQAVHQKQSGKPLIRFASAKEDIRKSLTTCEIGKECLIIRAVGEHKELDEFHGLFYARCMKSRVNVRCLTSSVHMSHFASGNFLTEALEIPPQCAGLTDLIVTETSVIHFIVKEEKIFLIVLQDAILAASEKARLHVLWQFVELLRRYV